MSAQVLLRFQSALSMARRQKFAGKQTDFYDAGSDHFYNADT